MKNKKRIDYELEDMKNEYFKLLEIGELTGRNGVVHPYEETKSYKKYLLDEKKEVKRLKKAGKEWTKKRKKLIKKGADLYYRGI